MTVDVDKEKLSGRDLLCEDTLEYLFPGVYDVTGIPCMNVDRREAQEAGSAEEQVVIEFVRRYPDAVVAGHHATDNVVLLGRRPPDLPGTERVGRDVVVASCDASTHILLLLED